VLNLVRFILPIFFWFFKVPLKMELLAGGAEILLDGLTCLALNTHNIPQFLTGERYPLLNGNGECESPSVQQSLKFDFYLSALFILIR
jgi:hypothetical protein